VQRGPLLLSISHSIYAERTRDPDVSPPRVGRSVRCSVRGVWVSADALQRMIVSGGRWPEERAMSAEAKSQLRLRLRNACMLGLSFVAAGFTAVVDDIVIGSRVEDLLEELGGRRFVFVMLTPRLDVVREREWGRGTRLWEAWDWLDDEIRTRTRRIGLWLDNSDQTPEQTVDEILHRGWTKGLVEARDSL